VSRPRPTRAPRLRRPFAVLSPHDQPALDALRGLAALAVVVTHVGFQTGATQQGLAGGVAARLDCGVAIFFVLSGYLLTAPHVKAAHRHQSSPAARRYFWHRALRILPAYWVACIAVVCLMPENRDASAGTVLRNLGLVQIYRRGDLLQGFTQTWSLATEVVFYLLLPLLGTALVSSLRRGRLASAVTVTGTLVTVNIVFVAVSQGTTLLDKSLTGFWLPSFTSWFAAGMALAVLRHGDHPRLIMARSWLDVAAVAPLAWWTIAAGTLLVASTPLAGPRGFESVPTPGQAIAKNLLYLVVAVCLVVPLVFRQDQPTAVVRWLGSRPWRFAGEISYGVFLWHLLVLATVMRLVHVPLFGGDFWLVLLLTVSASVLVATASLFLVERPALWLRDRGPGRRPGPHSVETSGPTDGGPVATAASAAATHS
jgi:peptidoglycan/LPS O-acetylase OafA/YrhL